MDGKLPHAEVTVFTPRLSPMKYRLTDQPVAIGRASDCQVPIRDRYLSRKHAEILPEDGVWVLKDCGSANGTYLNGARVEKDIPLRSGDRVRLGDSEFVFQIEQSTGPLLSVANSRVSASISISVQDLEQNEPPTSQSHERLQVLNALALELIEDQPLNQLFGFIVDRIMEHLHPSRAAIGLLADEGTSFASVEVRRQDSSDSSELAISGTLLKEVVEGKRALAFMDVASDEKLGRANSMILQGIHSVLCAPLLIGGHVVGVLYIDFLFNQRSISEDDVRLVAQIARFAAIKLENTRLREDSIQTRLMEEELRTASEIQRSLLPVAPPQIAGYTLSGVNRPCRTVSGDYFDFVVRPNGTLYFVIADVSGKGVTAALLMAGLQATFRILTKTDPAPAELVRNLNLALKENLPVSKFVTLVAGRLESANGRVEFANAGHTPPLWIRRGEVTELSETDLLLGVSVQARYVNQSLTLECGDSLTLFTDGISEAENEAGEFLDPDSLRSRLTPLHGAAAAAVATVLEGAAIEHAGDLALADDVTLVVISRDAAE